jgi:hypothetical protein
MLRHEVPTPISPLGYFVSRRSVFTPPYLFGKEVADKERSNIEGVVRAASLGCPAIGEWKWGAGDIAGSSTNNNGLAVKPTHSNSTLLNNYWLSDK